MCFDFISLGIQIFQSLPAILILWYVSFEMIIVTQFRQKSLLLWA